MNFTVEMTLTSTRDGGDTVIAGDARVHPGNVQVTAGGRLTAYAARGGKTIASVEDEVASKLGKLAARVARKAGA